MVLNLLQALADSCITIVIFLPYKDSSTKAGFELLQFLDSELSQMSTQFSG
jgi:hypothetical protein